MESHTHAPSYDVPCHPALSCPYNAVLAQGGATGPHTIPSAGQAKPLVKVHTPWERTPGDHRLRVMASQFSIKASAEAQN